MVKITLRPRDIARLSLLEKFSDPIPVLDQGYIKLVDVFGDDTDVVAAARTSYVGNETDEGKRTDEQNERLIRLLFRSRHGTPFEMPVAKFQVRIPMDAWRQWIRHRTMSLNEYSTRYRPPIDAIAKTDPSAWRLQSKDSKQGSSGIVHLFDNDWLDVIPSVSNPEQAQTHPDAGSYLSEREQDFHKAALDLYRERTEVFGVAREQARKDLPLSTYTEAVITLKGRNLFHFLGLRLDPDAQQEIRRYAEAIFEIVKEWLPMSSRAFVDYELAAVTFSRMEVEALRLAVSSMSAANREEIIRAVQAVCDRDGRELTKRERREFADKLGIALKND